MQNSIDKEFTIVLDCDEFVGNKALQRVYDILAYRIPSSPWDFW